jgi:hypothetical protein
MIDVRTDNFPPFLEHEFECMAIPGDRIGFAVTYWSSRNSNKECVTCGRIADSIVSIRYSGEQYTVKYRKTISLATFEKLYNAIPPMVRKSGFIGAEDILDGETYFVKFYDERQQTRLVLANPRQSGDDNIGALARQLDDVIEQC